MTRAEVVRVKERSRNLKLETDESKIGVCVCVTFGISEVHNDLFGLLGAGGQVVIGAPCNQLLDLFHVGQLIVDADEANCCVRVEEVQLFKLTDWGLLVKKFSIQLQKEVLMPRSLSIVVDGVEC